MPSEQELEDALGELLGNFQPKIQAWPAMMVAVAGSVRVPGRKNYVWIQMPSGSVVAVFNVRVVPAAYQQVMVGYDPVNPSFLQVLTFRAQGGNIQSTLGIGPHADTHKIYGAGTHGGSDIVWIEAQQFLPMKVQPGSGLAVKIFQTVILTTAGGWMLVSASSIDLSGYAPGAGLSRWVLIYLDSLGVVQAQAGTQVAESITTLSPDNIPTLLPGRRPLGAVKLYTGQTQVRDDAGVRDILDLRFSLKAGTYDGLAMVSSNDTTPGYLNGKLINGSHITITENNDGANETLTIEAEGVSEDTFWEAKGDLAVGTGPNAAARLPAGSTGQVLSVDPTQPTGLKWIDAPQGSASISPSPSKSPSASQSGSPSSSLSPSASKSVSPSASISPSSSASASASASKSPSGSVSPSASTSPSASGGGAIAAVYSITATDDVVVNPDPVSDTAIDSLEVTFSLSVDSIVLVMFTVQKGGAHPDKYAIYDNGSLKSGGLNIYDYTSGDNVYQVSEQMTLALTAGSHDITIQANAVSSTASITYHYRTLVVMVFA